MEIRDGTACASNCQNRPGEQNLLTEWNDVSHGLNAVEREVRRAVMNGGNSRGLCCWACVNLMVDQG